MREGGSSLAVASSGLARSNVPRQYAKKLTRRPSPSPLANVLGSSVASKQERVVAASSQKRFRLFTSPRNIRYPPLTFSIDDKGTTAAKATTIAARYYLPVFGGREIVGSFGQQRISIKYADHAESVGSLSEPIYWKLPCWTPDSARLVL